MLTTILLRLLILCINININNLYPSLHLWLRLRLRQLLQPYQRQRLPRQSSSILTSTYSLKRCMSRHHLHHLSSSHNHNLLLPEQRP